MSRGIKIEVTQEDIARGFKDGCLMCPVALALRRTLKSLAVDVNTVSLKALIVEDVYHRDVATMPTPVKVRRFINKFDGGKPVKPFTFYFKPGPL